MANRWQNQGGHPTSQTPPGRLTVPGRVRTQAKQPAKAPPGLRGATAPKPAPPPPQRILPVKILQAFYQNLPDASLQQIAHASSFRYSNQSMIVDGRVILTTLVVPSLTVYVLTDIEFYAIGPGAGLGAAPVGLNPYALEGMIHFELEFNKRPPMYMVHQAAQAYPTVPAPALQTNGWSFLDTKFGAVRSTGFAVYARGNETVQLYAIATALNQLPQFPVSKLGVKLNGFSINENAFDSVWLSAGNVAT